MTHNDLANMILRGASLIFWTIFVILLYEGIKEAGVFPYLICIGGLILCILIIWAFVNTRNNKKIFGGRND